MSISEKVELWKGYFSKRSTTAMTYLKIGLTVLAISYVADKCDAGDKIEWTCGKAKQGIDYIVTKD